jgi:hypothetical protein
LALERVGTTAYYVALKALHDAEYSLAQAKAEAATAQANASVFPGDPLGAAMVAIRTARAALARDVVGSAQYWNDLKALHDAQYAYATAQLDAANVAAQLGSDLTNPVEQAILAVQDAQARLARDAGAGAPSNVLDRDALAVKSAENAAEAAAFNQRFSDAQTNDQLGRISHQAYLSYLKHEHDRLTSIAGRTRQQQDELNQIDQAIKSANEQLTGQFNLGDIKIPTPYEARRSIAAQMGGGSYTGLNSTVTITINGADVDKVKQVLGQYIGPAALTARTAAPRRT